MYATRETLIVHDRPREFEYPEKFDYEALQARVQLVHHSLEKALGRSLELEGGYAIQDASFSFQIELRSTRESENAWHVCSLRFSNFGSLVAVTDEDYEVSDECQIVFLLAQEFGFIPVEWKLLDQDYDGVGGKFESWWVKFFDYL